MLFSITSLHLAQRMSLWYIEQLLICNLDQSTYTIFVSLKLATMMYSIVQGEVRNKRCVEHTSLTPSHSPSLLSLHSWTCHLGFDVSTSTCTCTCTSLPVKMEISCEGSAAQGRGRSGLWLVMSWTHATGGNGYYKQTIPYAYTTMATMVTRTVSK